MAEPTEPTTTAGKQLLSNEWLVTPYGEGWDAMARAVVAIEEEARASALALLREARTFIDARQDHTFMILAKIDSALATKEPTAPDAVLHRPGVDCVGWDWVAETNAEVSALVRAAESRAEAAERQAVQPAPDANVCNQCGQYAEHGLLCDECRAESVQPAPDAQAGAGWWHPVTCANAHNDDGNCLDSEGSLVGWPEVRPVTVQPAPDASARQHHSGCCRHDGPGCPPSPVAVGERHDFGTRPCCATVATPSFEDMMRTVEAPRSVVRMYRLTHDDECNCSACIAYDNATEEAVQPAPDALALAAEALRQPGILGLGSKSHDYLRGWRAAADYLAALANPAPAPKEPTND